MKTTAIVGCGGFGGGGGDPAKGIPEYGESGSRNIDRIMIKFYRPVGGVGGSGSIGGTRQRRGP